MFRPMPRPSVSTVLVALALACGPGSSGDQTQPTKLAVAEPTAEPEQPAASASQTVRAAGLELKVPGDWIVLGEDEPNFALAYGPEHRSAHIPVCTIELLRQGLGPLPADARELDGGVLEYQRGALRGRVRMLAGPQGSPGSAVVVHCRAPRSSRQWQAVTEIFASLTETGAAVELPPRRPSPSPEAIVELCVETPARMTRACARRADGAVYCGATTGDSLTRVALAEPAVEISCTRGSACARDAEGRVHCWQGYATPELLPELTGIRDIEDDNIVDGKGRLLRRGRGGVTELAPLDDPSLKLGKVERVLAGSNPAWGCVLRSGELWCWDREGVLPVRLAEGGGPQRLAAAPGATELRRIGDRLCVATDGRWTCTDVDGRSHALDGCETRACGCSLIGATRLACEHETREPIDARPLGRVSDVVVVTEPCAARADGTVVCRGPIAGQPDDPRQTRAIASELPGIAHVLELRDD